MLSGFCRRCHDRGHYEESGKIEFVFIGDRRLYAQNREGYEGLSMLQLPPELSTNQVLKHPHRSRIGHASLSQGLYASDRLMGSLGVESEPWRHFNRMGKL